jgi:hypothetical protein
MADDDVGERLLGVLNEFGAITRQLPAEDAADALDNAILEVFWRDWPPLRSWTESLWQRTHQDLDTPATPVSDPEIDEVGGEG